MKVLIAHFVSQMPVPSPAYLILLDLGVNKLSACRWVYLVNDQLEELTN
jgi:hypothetical protein